MELLYQVCIVSYSSESAARVQQDCGAVHEGLGIEVCRWLLSTGGVVRGGWGSSLCSLYSNSTSLHSLHSAVFNVLSPSRANQASEAKVHSWRFASGLRVL